MMRTKEKRIVWRFAGLCVLTDRGRRMRGRKGEHESQDAAE